jgi:CheY-like chemotaxis protein
MIPHILIVDSDQNAARVTAAIVTRVVPDATMTVVPTADQGRQCVPAQPPNILLIDMSSNQLDDERLIRTVKAFNPDALVIALTALAPRTAARRFPTSQIDGYVEKGGDPIALKEALSEALRQRALLPVQPTVVPLTPNKKP